MTDPNSGYKYMPGKPLRPGGIALEPEEPEKISTYLERNMEAFEKWLRDRVPEPKRVAGVSLIGFKRVRDESDSGIEMVDANEYGPGTPRKLAHQAHPPIRRVTIEVTIEGTLGGVQEYLDGLEERLTP